MRRSLKVWLSVMAVVCGAVPASAAEPGQEPFSKPGVTTFVGDLSVKPSAEPFGHKPTVAPFGHQDETTPFGHQAGEEDSFESIKKVGYTSSCSDDCNDSCDTFCDSGDCCDSAGGAGGCLTGGKHRAWGRIETLLWWAQDRDSPVLFSTSPDPAVLPILGAAGIPLYGDPIESDLLFGNRIDFGLYCGEDDAFGFGARIYGIWNGEDTHTEASSPGRALGIPVLDISPNPPVGDDSAFLLSLNTGFLPTPDITGGGSVTTELEFIASEIYGRAMLLGGSNHRIDLISGYTFHSVDDSLLLQARSTRFNAVGPVETLFLQDRFEAENTFHGGQVGFEAQLTKGKWMFSSLTKVHLGNMKQRLLLRGATSRRTGDGGVGSVETFNSNVRGLLVQGNHGVTEDNTFTFVPEANVKLGYQLCDCAFVTVGYSFMMWSEMMLAGENIDNRIDPSRVGNALPVQAMPDTFFESESFFLHGLDLGLTLKY